MVGKSIVAHGTKKNSEFEEKEVVEFENRKANLEKMITVIENGKANIDKLNTVIENGEVNCGLLAKTKEGHFGLLAEKVKFRQKSICGVHEKVEFGTNQLF